MAMTEQQILAQVLKGREALKKSKLEAPVRDDLGKKVDVVLGDLKVRVPLHDKLVKEIEAHKAKARALAAAVAEFKKSLPKTMKDAGVALDAVNTLRKGGKTEPAVSELFLGLSALYAKGLGTDVTLEDDK